jgi:putative nucleotidyltransferase with HDIG domain
MTDKIKKIADSFAAEGYELYEVGGCVRDELLGKDPKDIDLTTNATPDVSERILKQFGFVYTVGIEYGTVGLSIGDKNIEITTYRKEVYPTDSRKPSVVFGTELIEDLRRRDFTINSIARNPLTGKYVDPFGGLIDLIDNKIIQCVGSDARLDEDPLRMMRAVRFACKFEFVFGVDIKHPERLKIISKERVKDELSKILLTNTPVRGIKLLCDTGLMQYIIPDLLKLINLKQNKNHIADAFEHTMLVLEKSSNHDFGEDNLIFRLAALLHDIAKPQTYSNYNGAVHFYNHHVVGGDMVESILTDLKFDTNTIERVKNLVKRHMEPIMMTINDALDKRSVSRLMRRVSNDTHNDIEMLLSLTSCDLSSSANPRQQFVTDLRALVAEVQSILPKQECPLNGDEIMDLLNIKPSRIIKDIKEYLCDQVVEGIVLFDDKKTLGEITKKYYEEHKYDQTEIR